MNHWLIHGDLPPTGNPILLDADTPPPQFDGYSAHWLNSGTAALALALIIARQQRPEVHEPQVILPAYGCPDLVAAAEFAKVRPLLVDIGHDDPGYNLDSLERALGPQTVAVVAVNFLGIRERLAALQSLTSKHPGTLLIEDNAQWMPAPDDKYQLSADLVCLSFGRGKPVSLLGGGALLISNRSRLRVPEGTIGAAVNAGATYKLKIVAFNALLNRYIYWGVNRNPLVTLGRTEFKPLTAITSMDSDRQRYLGANIAASRIANRSSAMTWQALAAVSPKVKLLAIESNRIGRYLRYPLLCEDQNVRTRLLKTLDSGGFGSSLLYQRPLIEIENIHARVGAFESNAGAKAFANRLLTLPLHSQVSAADGLRAQRVLFPVLTDGVR
jgi:dTDP-4-amino-4,6-dideoxygalactose transaminase